MSATTQLSDLRGRVRLALGDSSFDGPTIDRALNDAQNELCNRHEFRFLEVGPTTETQAQGAYTIPIPSTMQKITNLILAQPFNVRYDYSDRYMLFKQFTVNFPTPDQETQGMTTNWSDNNGNIYFICPADQTYTWRLFGLGSPAKMVNDSDLAVIPDEFCELLVIMAKERTYENDDDYQTAEGPQARAIQLERDLVRKYGRGQTKGGPTRMMNPFRGLGHVKY